MVFDIVTIVAIALAIIAGGAFYYVYNKYKSEKIDKVYYVISELYEKYGDLIKKDNPELAKECETTLNVLKKAMEDGEISIMEAFEITKAFVPLMTRLVKFVKSKYEN